MSTRSQKMTSFGVCSGLFAAALFASPAAAIGPTKPAASPHQSSVKSGGQVALTKKQQRKLRKMMPTFVAQPTVTRGATKAGATPIVRGDSGKRWMVSAEVLIRPWRTTKTNRSSKWDTVSLRLGVSKPGVAIRKVSLDPRAQSKALMTTAKVKQRVVKKAGVYRVSVPVSARVGRSLAKQSIKKQRKRIQFSILQHRDVIKSVSGREGTQVQQSGLRTLPTKQKRVAGTRSSSAKNQSWYATFNNFTPFDGQFSFQATQCMDASQVNAYPVQAGGWNSLSATVFNSGTQYANSQGSIQSNSQGVVNSLSGSASTAAANAEISGSALYSPGGAVSAATSWATTFVVDFLTGLGSNSCANQPALFTTSFVAQSVSPSASTSGAYIPGTNSATVNPVAAQVPPTSAMFSSALGAQTSTSWHWNDSQPVPSGPGSFNWAGGLMSNAGANSVFNDQIDTMSSIGMYFATTGDNLTGAGPSPQVWPPDPNIPGSPSLTAQWDGNNMALGCTPGEWQVANPWGDSLSMDLPNSGKYTTQQMYLAVGYNGTQNGVPVTNQPLPGVEPITVFSQAEQTIEVTSSALQQLPPGTTISEWVCTVSAALQVQAWDLPSSWPGVLSVNGSPNGAWWSAPNVVLTAPYVGP